MPDIPCVRGGSVIPERLERLCRCDGVDLNAATGKHEVDMNIILGDRERGMEWKGEEGDCIMPFDESIIMTNHVSTFSDFHITMHVHTIPYAIIRPMRLIPDRDANWNGDSHPLLKA